MKSWEVITRSLHKRGGGPLALAAFDDAFETTATASYAINKARARGLVESVREGRFLLWSLTQLGRDLCAGIVVLSSGKGMPLAAETSEAREKRIARLIAASDEAAATCRLLTNRQREVLSLAAKGYRHIEISAILSVHIDTVEMDRRHILSFLGCDRTIEAAVLAAKAGLA